MECVESSASLPVLTMSANSEAVVHPGVMRVTDLQDVMHIENRNYDFPWSEGVFRDCIRVGYTAQVLRLDLVLVGYGVMQIAADEAHILNLCIDKDYNHRGYARLLLERLLSIAERAGAQMAFLEARPSNPRAIALYANAGFNEVGLRRNYYDSKSGREDAIVMAKTLTAAAQ